FAADDHHKKNAEALVNEEAANMVVQNGFTPESFIRLIRDILKQPDRLERLSVNIRKFHRPRAAEETAKVLLAEMAGKIGHE
ncbi:MAG: hypothetical protein KDD43_13470, partial [Bdellovibrionales bacterium]|nr:hypothetical protein [Bdellovibrionales bacterium]